ncbi:MAG TPA: class I SAM-dependent methyltransferase [Chitinophagaceae bacterium]|jgi:SAM-dependent methyltransferase|nr:class I SAM-dependent methyltransferase [Chitinophagaceae bacterium]
MKNVISHNVSSIIKENTLYYDGIAPEYDRFLDKDSSNETIRQEVAREFHKKVGSGLVLDFGGGTGKDLQWLTEKGYRVIFCEPSSKMREKAIDLINKNISVNNISILPEEKTDFTQWNVHAPSSEKADAILANFAVLNCIPNLDLLFKNLSIILNPNGHFFALILKSDFKNRWKSNRINAITSLFLGEAVKMSVKFYATKHTVTLHTIRQISKVSKPWFNFTCHPLQSTNNFSLIYLIRK